MRRKLSDILQEKRGKELLELNLHDFIEMKEAGLSDGEIASELGISRSLVLHLGNEITKDY
ncbi:hypothetical protein [Alkaliphilus serpentinus]|uniref:Uncharacterized protein n=1 Tax=Alkaliphilus serpentinus TaxID=1482731 RepID=A0A833HMP0_9FIRM|nr:hypothetical protein [Alkaliphilus serpentinus]KAB3527666.1 hypothetical protein F8153_11840 [Alkaliphilus serpentinus]